MMASDAPAHAILNGFGGQPRTACGALDRSPADLSTADFDRLARFTLEGDRPSLCSDCLRVLYGRDSVASGRDR